MQKDKLKNKLYTNLLLILATFGVIYFIIYPMYSGQGMIYSPEKSIPVLTKEKKDYKDAISLADGYSEKVLKVNNDYVEAINTLPIDNLNKVLPSAADPVMVIYELSQIAQKPNSNMLLTNPKFSDNGQGNSDANRKYNTLTISFSLEGTYDNLKSFLKNLEKSERIYNVTSLDFTSNQETKDYSALKYSITVETYYLKQK